MRSRRDQLQAYQFLRRRIVAALLSGEPDALDSPMRRIVRTTFAGTMVAVILLGGFGFFGLIRKGSATSWKQGNSLIIQKEDGARFVWFGGKLHPMLNFASARLLLGPGDPKSVSRRSLAGVPRTPTLGIPLAPDSLPTAHDLIRAPWTVCAQTKGGGAEVTVLGGLRPSSGSLTADEGLVVTASATPGADKFVVWRQQLFRVADPRLLAPLFVSAAPIRPVGAAWLTALPRSSELRFPDIAGRGGPGPSIGSRRTRVGQVVFVHSGVGADHYYVVLNPGLSPISAGVAQLLLYDPRSKTAYPTGRPLAIQIGAGEFTSAFHVGPLLSVNRYPDRPLKPAGSPDGAVCASLPGTSSGGDVAVYSVPSLPEAAANAVRVPAPDSGQGPALADRI